MSERTTEQVLSEIRNTQHVAERDLDSVPFATRAGFGMAITQARTELGNLRQEYRRRILSNSVGFAVHGPRAEEFAQVAAQAAPSVIVVDADGLYATLADRLEPTMGSQREFTGHQLAALATALREVALAAGVTMDLKMPQLGTLRAVPDRQAMIDLIRELVQGSIGTTLSSLYISNKVVEQAMATEFTGNVLVSVVLNAGVDNARELSAVFASTFEVPTEMGTEVTEEFVIKTFDAAKTKRTKKQK